MAIESAAPALLNRTAAALSWRLWFKLAAILQRRQVSHINLKDRAGSDSISDCRGRKSRRRFRGDIYCCSQNLGQKWHKLSCVDEPPGQALLPRLTDCVDERSVSCAGHTASPNRVGAAPAMSTATLDHPAIWTSMDSGSLHELVTIYDLRGKRFPVQTSTCHVISELICMHIMPDCQSRI